MEDNIQNLPKNFVDFYTKHSSFFEQPVVKAFLEIPEHSNLLVEAFLFPSSENVAHLNARFRGFYLRAKIYKYLSSLIHFFSVDFDKRERNRRERYQLIVDRPINGEQDSGQNMLDHLDHHWPDLEDQLSLGHLSNLASDRKLYKAINHEIHEKQRKILYLFYVEGYANKEIAQLFNESPQNISSLRKKSLEKLRKAAMNKPVERRNIS
ncbi:sigma-70 family RNA polymerase sigma factor [Bacillus infantis]|uniref:sigma-70 family RNA polymerase sigma factor n=1 Tax=Bacillus infantis TaxID=324767 RepID=UPI000B9A9623|nr:sigma-70 family RNA polymerase sigma factor [Bacillus infantis]MCK6207086.1 sigma-70 family RNA polymerase sigma factor [Bacillus infantis]OXT15141.1 hypothetical protein B9K06_22810 [Bacillus sp. OG2]